MKLMLISDLTQVKGFAVSTLLICIFIVAVMTFSMGTSIVGAAAIAAMLPYMIAYSVLANDEVIGWAKMRATMPLSRRDVVFGRYLGTLIIVATGIIIAIALALAASALFGAIGIGIDAQDPEIPGGSVGAIVLVSILGGVGALVMLAIVLPIVMRFGLSRTSRILPLALVLVFCIGIPLLPESVFEAAFTGITPVALGFGAVAIALVLFAVSALISCKLYELREF